jgi:hypothetical protein
MEGFVKALIPGMDFTPYLYGTPSYQMGASFSGVGAIVAAGYYATDTFFFC